MDMSEGKMCDSVSSHLKMLTPSNSALVRLFECHICLDTMYTPIFQCQYGHTICDLCIVDMNTCPTCRENMPKQRIRNLALENVIEVMEFNCRNEAKGCHVKFLPGDFNAHLLDCSFEMISLKEIFPECTCAVAKSEILQHLKNDHNIKSYTSNRNVVYTNNLHVLSDFFKVPTPIHLQSFNSTFFLIREFIQRGDQVLWRIILVGSSKAAKQFQAKISLCAASIELQCHCWSGSIWGMDDDDFKTSTSGFTVSRKCLQTLKQCELRIEVTTVTSLVTTDIYNDSSEDAASSGVPLAPVSSNHSESTVTHPDNNHIIIPEQFGISALNEIIIPGDEAGAPLIGDTSTKQQKKRCKMINFFLNLNRLTKVFKRNGKK